MAIKQTHTFEGLKYNLDNRDRVAASAATQALDIGTVTQATNHTTAVTINAHAGIITCVADAINATVNAEFTVNNNKVQADSVILITMQDENTTNSVSISPSIHTIAAGSFVISLHNTLSSGNTSATASKIHFLVINNDG